MQAGMKYLRGCSVISRLALSNPSHLFRLIRIRHDHLTYLDLPALVDLRNAVAYIEKQRIPGVLIEAGIALGGSALAITSAKNVMRELQVYDTFEMIPPPSKEDGDDAHQRYEEIARGNSQGLGGDRYYGYMGDLSEKIQETFAKYGYPIETNHVRLIKGLFQETLYPKAPVALAHLDCDWFASVMICLERIVPLLSVGGVIVIDDYDHWSGARRAVEAYFSQQKKENFQFIHRSRLHIRRTS